MTPTKIARLLKVIPAIANPLLPRLEINAAIPRIAPSKPSGNPTQFNTFKNGIKEIQTPKIDNIPITKLAIPIIFS